MNHAEMVILIRYVKAVCPAQTIDQLTPDAWFDIIGDLQLEDCRAAVTALKRGNNPPAFVDVGDIRRMVREIRNDRIEKGPLYEPDSGMSVAEWRRAIADGAPVPAPAGLARRDMRAIEGTFRSVPAR